MSNKKHFSLHLHSHYSLLDAIGKPEMIAKRITELDMDGCAISDHGNVSGSISFLKEMKKANKKPIIGCELYISEHDADVKNENNRKHSHLVVLAKNDQGWRQLLKIMSLSNSKDNFYYKPRLSLNQLATCLDGNIIGFAGHFGSVLANEIMLNDEKIAPNGIADEKIAPNGIADGLKITNRLIEIFGKDNFYLECQLIDKRFQQLADIVRDISRQTNTKIIATEDAHYCYPHQWEDHHVALATNLNKNLHQCTDPAFGMSNFFLNKHYYIHSYDELLELGNTEEELENTLKVAALCEPYKEILKSPIAPPFECPEGYDANAWLRKLCNDGWSKLPQNRTEGTYEDRLAEELAVLEKANLASYFLVIEDILSYVRQHGWLSGPGRGSAAGCLVSYLIGITQVDPIPYGLLFSRFYNEGRNTKDRVAMPDIDIDIPAGKREQIINYIKDKFGHDKVSQMATYQTMKGRGALKSVLRAHNVVTAAEQNIITKFFPEEAKIMDELQVMKEEEGESSIIQWTLENSGDKLREWCFVNEAGELEGPLAKYFAQAIRLEGTKANMSKHASGILIGPAPLDTLAPMVYDTKTESPICGFEMRDAEDAGLLKFDILGLSLLDKLMGIQDILEKGDIEE